MIDVSRDPSNEWDVVRAIVTNAMSFSLFTEISDGDIKALGELIKKENDSEKNARKKVEKPRRTGP